MKYIIVPLLVALAGWGIRPALADIHDALDRAESACGSGDCGRAETAADSASPTYGSAIQLSALK